jgi:hypothetical protein
VSNRSQRKEGKGRGALAKQRTISTRGLNIASHIVCIEEISLVPVKTQQPTKTVKINSLHAVSVPPHESAKCD